MPLTFVPTPLGNLRDITLRAIDVLREAHTIVAEDTRVARRLLSALEISGNEILRCDEHSAHSTLDAIVARARTDRVAVVTDAGTPGISDPGTALIKHARAAGIAVEVLPGPTAFVVAAVLSGFDVTEFVFGGFLPRTTKLRRAEFERALTRGVTTIWYEAPHRILASLEQLANVAPRTPVFLARELTKLHEQHLYGTAAEVAAGLELPVRGEIVLVLSPVKIDVVAEADAESVDRAIDAALAAGDSVATIARTLATRGLGERRALYARAFQRKDARR
jgi:16S rRNA (cytidine1402-2'-O)-methyltransferase